MSDERPVTETCFGFQWGGVSVERAAELPDGTLVLTIRSEHRSLQVGVSPKGHRMHIVGPLSVRRREVKPR